jgi:hypothetical protein
VVTFDDGHADNREVIEPLEHVAGVSPTVCVVNGVRDVNRTCWWGDAEALGLRT